MNNKQRVIYDHDWRKIFPRLILPVLMILSGCSRSANPIRLTAEYRTARQMAVDENKVVTTYSQRDPSELVEVDSLEPIDLESFARWLDKNGKDPLAYAVETAANHEITLFGELHGQRDTLTFFNRIIPSLYHDAGVTCIALECIIPQENDRLARLVTAESFDREQAINILRRSDIWRLWGWKGYVDIFETVWRLNKDLPEEKKKMRVVGIGLELDGPSMAKFGAGGTPPIACSRWNKLRIFILVDDLIRASMCDRLYAYHVAHETIEKGDRGVVLVGSAHTSLNQLWPHGQGGKLYRERARMGFMLHQKYGDRVFQILFHGSLARGKKITRCVEQVAAEQKHRPFGCDIKDSPFGTLRDSSTIHFRLQPGVCLSDMATGYLYLNPMAQQKCCEWIDGYITEEMFAKHKRYYEARIGKELDDHDAANQAFSHYAGW